ncbi:MAG: glycosyltransferase family A protein [Cyclobacteriaceae bacterium]
MYTISVLIPVYNRRESLVRAIESVLEQTYMPEEIIVADDASDFDVKTYLQKEYPHISEQIKVVRGKENKGVSGARNLALRNSSGDLIALLDSDDRWHPEKIEKQLAVFKKDPTVDLVFCRQWIVRGSEQKEHEKKLYRKNLFDHLITDWHAPNPSTLLMKRNFLENIPFNETMRNLEDLDWWLRFSLLEPNVQYVDEFLMYYCINEENRLSYIAYEERFKRVEKALAGWEHKVVQERGKKQYKAFRQYLLTYHAIDAFVACSRRKDFFTMFKITSKYLWNKKRFYQLFSQKLSGSK